MIGGDEVVERLPALADREPSGGYLFYDCQTDDVRLVLTVLGEAERFGAVFANGLEVTGLVEEGGRAQGAEVRDAETGETFTIGPRPSSTPPACGRTASAPTSSTTRPRCR